MDLFAYAVLGLCGLLVLAWVGAHLAALTRDTIGRAILLGYGIILLAASAMVSAVWLIATH